MKRVLLLLALLVCAATTAPAHAGVAPAPEIPGRPTDKELLAWMRQPALETLSKVDYVRIDDGNIESVTLGGKAFTMVLFMTDVPQGKGVNASRGMAALVTALKLIFPEVELAVYQVNDTGKVSVKEFERLHEMYEIRNVPTMLFYSSTMGITEKGRHLTGLDRGITWDGDLLLQVDHYARDYIPDYLNPHGN